MSLGVLGPAKLARYPYSAAANGVDALGVIDHWCWDIPAVKKCHDEKAVPYAQQQCAAQGDSTKACIDGQAEAYLRRNCGCPSKDPKKTSGGGSSPVYAPKPTTTEELEPVEPTIFGIPQKLVMLGGAAAALYFFVLKKPKKAA